MFSTSYGPALRAMTIERGDLGNSCPVRQMINLSHSIRNGAKMRRLFKGLVLLTASFAAAGLASCANSRTTKAPVPDVVFVPTPFPVVDQMLDVARLRTGDVLFDLGSGDGRIVIAAAKRFGIKATGIDIDPRRIAESRVNADTAGVTNLVDFREADLFTTDLRSATVVTLYLLPALNVRLRPKLFAELRPGSRVVSHSFDMGDWQADSTLRVDARIVYFWLMPSDVSGRWTVTASSGSNVRCHELSITQKYQRITGTAVGDDAVRIDSAAIRGDSIRFVLGVARFQGRVRGESMEGSFSERGGLVGTWRAVRRSSGSGSPTICRKQ